MNPRKALISGLMVCVIVAACIPILSEAVDGDDPYAIPLQDTSRDEVRSTVPEKGSRSPVPADTRSVVDRVEAADVHRQIVDVEYVDDAIGVRIHAGGDVSEFRRIVEAYRSSIPVSVVQSPYTLRQLDDGIDELLRDSNDFDGALIDISPRTDGTGIQVTLDRRHAGRMSPETYRSLTDIPLDVTYGDPPLETSRWSDGAPYSTGARIRNGKLSCTSGFWGTNGKTAQLITANHCGAGGKWYAGTSKVMVGAGKVASYSDIVSVSSPKTLPRRAAVYWGSYLSNSAFAVSGVTYAGR